MLEGGGRAIELFRPEGAVGGTRSFTVGARTITVGTVTGGRTGATSCSLGATIGELAGVPAGLIHFDMFFGL